ncbi:hypothetical protein HDV62DRAFT_105465 [Trichoderma sp. SZMC 28011]
MEASPLPHKARGSKNHKHTWWLTVYCYCSCTAVEAACYATLPGYGGRGTGRISALAGLVWWSRPDRQRCYTEALGCMAWLAGKRDMDSKTTWTHVQVPQHLLVHDVNCCISCRVPWPAAALHAACVPAGTSTCTCTCTCTSKGPSDALLDE